MPIFGVLIFGDFFLSASGCNPGTESACSWTWDVN